MKTFFHFDNLDVTFNFDDDRHAYDDVVRTNRRRAAGSRSTESLKTNKKPGTFALNRLMFSSVLHQ